MDKLSLHLHRIASGFYRLRELNNLKVDLQDVNFGSINSSLLLSDSINEIIKGLHNSINDVRNCLNEYKVPQKNKDLEKSEILEILTNFEDEYQKVIALLDQRNFKLIPDNEIDARIAWANRNNELNGILFVFGKFINSYNYAEVRFLYWLFTALKIRLARKGLEFIEDKLNADKKTSKTSSEDSKWEYFESISWFYNICADICLKIKKNKFEDVKDLFEFDLPDCFPEEANIIVELEAFLNNMEIVYQEESDSNILLGDLIGQISSNTDDSEIYLIYQNAEALRNDAINKKHKESFKNDQKIFDSLPELILKFTKLLNLSKIDSPKKPQSFDNDKLLFKFLVSIRRMLTRQRNKFNDAIVNCLPLAEIPYKQHIRDYYKEMDFNYRNGFYSVVTQKCGVILETVLYALVEEFKDLYFDNSFINYSQEGLKIRKKAVFVEKKPSLESLSRILEAAGIFSHNESKHLKRLIDIRNRSSHILVDGREYVSRAEAENAISLLNLLISHVFIFQSRLKFLIGIK